MDAPSSGSEFLCPEPRLWFWVFGFKADDFGFSLHLKGCDAYQSQASMLVGDDMCKAAIIAVAPKPLNPKPLKP